MRAERRERSRLRAILAGVALAGFVFSLAPAPLAAAARHHQGCAPAAAAGSAALTPAQHHDDCHDASARCEHALHCVSATAAALPAAAPSVSTPVSAQAALAAEPHIPDATGSGPPTPPPNS